jgi:hypothetical protein
MLPEKIYILSYDAVEYDVNCSYNIAWSFEESVLEKFLEDVQKYFQEYEKYDRDYLKSIPDTFSKFIQEHDSKINNMSVSSVNNFYEVVGTID